MRLSTKRVGIESLKVGDQYIYEGKVMYVEEIEPFNEGYVYRLTLNRGLDHQDFASSNTVNKIFFHEEK